VLSINTNLSNLLIQKSLRNSTNILNSTIERMSTGFKINSAKDNAANYAITQDMSNHISSLDVAEDNATMGLDYLNTADEYLALISERYERLRNLAMEASNNTYGEDSLKAINAECEAIVQDIKQIYNEAEYNGIKMYGSEAFETIVNSGTNPISFFNTTEPDTTPQNLSTVLATENTTLEELGINNSSFCVYNSTHQIIESYDVVKDDTLKDIFNVLTEYGIDGVVVDGVVNLVSSKGNYIKGDLTEKLGMSLGSVDYIESTSQSSSNSITYTQLMTANESTTLEDLGVLLNGNDKITVNNKYGDKITEIAVNPNTTLGGIFDSLGNHNIQGSIDAGVISLSSNKGNYVVAEGVISSLGIADIASGNVTYGSSQTSSAPITYQTVTVSGGEVVNTQLENVTTIYTTTTTSTTNTVTIWATNTVETTFTIFTSKSNTLMIENTNQISNPSYTSAEVSAMIAIQSASSFISGQKYKISTAEDLAYLATQVNLGKDTTGAIFVLANDIDLKDWCLSHDGGWVPIGTFENPFKGSFDGNGHIINNLIIDSSSISDVGLLGYSETSGYIKNVGLENVDISVKDGADNVGALIGYADNSIENCYAIAKINTSGVVNVGGLIGNYGFSGTINNCYTSICINVSSAFTGGLVGCIAGGGCISNSYSKGNIVGPHDLVGGLIGSNRWGWIKNSYSMVDVAEGAGFVNYSEEGIYDYCYATGNSTHGFVCSMTFECSFDNCASVVQDSEVTQMTLTQIESIYTPDLMGLTSNNGWCILNNTPIFAYQEGIRLYEDSRLENLLTKSAYIYLTDGTRLSYQYTANSTISDIISNLNASNKGLNAMFENNIINIIGNNGVNIDITSGNDNLFKLIPLNQSSYNSINNTTTTTSVTQTNTIYTTTTSSTTQTQTLDITVTTPIVYTTSNINATSDTTFNKLNLSSRGYITLIKDDTESILTIKTADTLQDLVTQLNNSGINATLTNSQLYLNPQNNGYFIKGMSDNMLNILNVSNSFYTTSLGVSSSDSDLQTFIETKTINQATNLSQVGVTSGELLVKKNGANYATVTVNSSNSVNDLISSLQSIGYSIGFSNGKLNLSANGDMIIEDSAANSSNLVNALKLNNINQNIETTYSNTPSNEIYTLNEIVKLHYIASGSIGLQIGITSDEASKLYINTGFSIDNVDKFANIGKNLVNNVDFVAELDEVIANISNKQVEIGAAQNRMMSVIESISINYENLVSARSTLKDADIAEESAIYIQQQILQQAAATLMATANQSPQLALQLI